MKNNVLQKHFCFIFKDNHYLLNIGGKTYLAGIFSKQKKDEHYCYVQNLKQFTKIKDEQIICKIKMAPRKVPASIPAFSHQK
jgi:hypothetical protein